MPTDCPFCGAAAKVTTEPFALDGSVVPLIAERCSCPACGEEWFTRNQLREFDLSRRKTHGRSCAADEVDA